MIQEEKEKDNNSIIFVKNKEKEHMDNKGSVNKIDSHLFLKNYGYIKIYKKI